MEMRPFYHELRRSRKENGRQGKGVSQAIERDPKTAKEIEAALGKPTTPAKAKSCGQMHSYDGLSQIHHKNAKDARVSSHPIRERPIQGLNSP